MYKLYFFLILSFIFFSADSYAYDKYDETYDIKEEEVCKTEDSSSKSTTYSCNIKSTSKDNANFEIEINFLEYGSSPDSKCKCEEIRSDFYTTFYSCDCQGIIPSAIRSFYFKWILFGTRKKTCEHFIKKIFYGDGPC